LIAVDIKPNNLVASKYLEVFMSIANHSSVSPHGYIYQSCNFFEFHNVIKSEKNYSQFSFKDNYRSGKNCIEAGNIIVLDVDEGISISQAEEKLQGLTYLIATTKSHQKEKRDKVCDRFRVFLPTVTNLPHDNEIFKRVVKNIVHELGLNVDLPTIENSRFFFGNKDALCQYNSGDILDWRTFHDSQEISVETKKNKRPPIKPQKNQKSIKNTFNTNATLIKKKCSAVSYAFKNSSIISYYQWFYTCGILSRCKDGQKLVHSFSKLDNKRYQYGETENNYNSVLGLNGCINCTTLNDVFPEQCLSCPYRGLISSPNDLGGKVLNFKVKDIAVSPQEFENRLKVNEDLAKYYKNKKITFEGHIFNKTVDSAEDTLKATIKKVLKDGSECTKARVEYYINRLFFSTEIMPVVIDISSMSSGKTYSVYALAQDILKVIEALPAKQKKLCVNKIRLVVQSPALLIQDKGLPFFNNDLFFHLEGRSESNCTEFKDVKLLQDKGHGISIKNAICKKCKKNENCNYYSNKLKAKESNTISNGVSVLGILKPLDAFFIDEGTARQSLFNSISINNHDLIKIYNFLAQKPEMKEYNIILSDLILFLNNLSNDPSEFQDNELREKIKSSKFFNLINEIEDSTTISTLLKNYFYKQFRSYLQDDIPYKGSIDFVDLIKNIDKYGISFDKKEQKLFFYSQSQFWEEMLEKVTGGEIKSLSIMDGTPDKYFIKLVEAKNIKYEVIDISVEPNKKQLFQYIDSSRSKRSLNNTLSYRDKQILKKIIKKILKKNREIVLIGLITFKAKIEEFKEFLQSEFPGIEFRFGYFGVHDRGTNEFNDCEELIIYGRYFKNISTLSAEAYVLSSFIDINFNSEVKVLGYPGTNKAVVRLHYNDLVNHHYENTMLQCINRVGRVKSNTVPKVHIFTDEPLNIKGIEYLTAVDLLNKNELTTKKQADYNEQRQNLSSDNRLKVENAIKFAVAQSQKITVRWLSSYTDLGKTTCNKLYNEIISANPSILNHID
jgi:hypothetical protein